MICEHKNRTLFVLRPACGLLLYLLGVLTRLRVAYQSYFRSSKLVVNSTVFPVRVLIFQGVCGIIKICDVKNVHLYIFVKNFISARLYEEYKNEAVRFYTLEDMIKQSIDI